MFCCALFVALAACTSGDEGPKYELDGGPSLGPPGTGANDASSTLDATSPDSAAPGPQTEAGIIDAAPDATPASAEAGPFVPNQDDPFLGLPEPAAGFRVKSQGMDVPNDSDVEFCEVAELPGTPDQEYIVRAVELANGLGSHHLVIGVAAPGSEAEAKLRSLKLGDKRPCYTVGADYGLGVTNLTFTQTPYRMADMPDGIAKRLHGGQRIIFDYHYFNYSGKTIRAKSALAFHLMEKDKLKNIANELGFSNFTIDTPPGATRVFKAACKLKHDMWLMNLVRHTHQKSTEFDVWYEGGPNHGKLVWSSKDWEHDTEHRFPEPILMKAGQGFKFSCGFRNDGNKNLRMGTAASDEMCILNGTIWSPEVGAPPPFAGCTTTWIDADGVSHEAGDYGGVPKPELGDELACHTGMLGASFLDGCVGCICGSCGTPYVRCQNDPDCKVLLECTSANKGPCTKEFGEHSSATGMITAVGTCIQTMCPKECAPAPSSDAGAP
ncbi:MAG TPA: hypothetical protein VFZ61_12215 [Polyangiales bacterium]